MAINQGDWSLSESWLGPRDDRYRETEIWASDIPGLQSSKHLLLTFSRHASESDINLVFNAPAALAAAHEDGERIILLREQVVDYVKALRSISELAGMENTVATSFIRQVLGAIPPGGIEVTT